jgi:tetratricopeptide (TPR) repeat protein
MPEPPVVAVREANAAMADKIETAYRALKSALNSADAWGRYGEVLHAAEYLDAARTCYLEALNRAPDSARWSHLLGLVQLQRA